MSIAQRLVNLSDGLSADGILSAAKGGTGTTTGAGTSTPTISAIAYGGDDTATAPAGGATITLTGTNFAAGAKVLINQTQVSVVTVVSSTQITFTAPALAAGSYILYVVNTDGSTAIAVPGIQYSGVPAWTTAAGTLGTSYETGAVSTTVSATSDSAVTYSVLSGTLPSGVTVNSNGTISGTSPLVAGSTTYTFTIRATDAEKQDTDRQFSLTINPDVVTWSSPANGAALGGTVNAALTPTTLTATSAAGQSISYSANSLPTGVTLSGSTISGTPTTVGTSSTTLTATSATTNKSAQITINWTISVASDTYFPYTTLLLDGETATQPFLADASTNNFQLTAYGDTRPSNFSPYVPIASSVYFNGSSDYLSSSGNATIATGEFTIEAWVFPTTLNTSNTVLDNSLWNIGQNGGYTFSINSSGKLVLGGSTGVWNSSSTWITSTSSVVTNRWQHVAITRDSSNVIRCFINGVVDATTTTYSASLNLSTAGGVTTNISRTVADGGTYNLFTGYISNVHAANGTGACKYTTTFTPSVYPIAKTATTVFLACNSRRLVDASTNAFTLTAGGSAAVNSFNPFLTNPSYANYGSTYFDGTGDYLSIPANAAFNLTGDFTVECWVYFVSLTPGDDDGWGGPTIVSIVNGGNSSTLETYLSINLSRPSQNAAPNGWNFSGGGGSIPSYGQVAINSTSITPTAGTWYHIALTRSGTAIKAFINGVLLGSATSAVTFGSSTITVKVGRLDYTYTRTLNGYVSNLHIVKGTALYTANFTPPAQPLTAVSGTSLLTCQTNQPHTNSQFLDNSTSAINITRAGNATQGSFSPYGANWSNYFDGSGDYLTIANNSNLSWTGNTDGSMEAWIYLTSSSATGTILSKSDISGSSYPNYAMAIVTGGYLNGYVGRSGFPGSGLGGVTSATAIPLNTWAHVLFTRKYVGGSEQNQYRIFVNGVLRGFTTNESPADSRAADCVIGGTGGGVSPFSGYISNVRFFNNSIPVEYQTSNQTVGTTIFTPSTAPLVTVTGTQLLTCQSQNFVDNSHNAFTVTRNGDTSTQKFSPFATVTQTPITHSVYFDGSTDWVTLPSSATAYNFGSGVDFTVEAWVYATAQAAGDWGIIDARVNGATAAAWLVTLVPSGAGHKVNFYNAGANSGTTVIPLNTWAHIAVTRSGTTLRTFVNGIVDLNNASYGSGPISPGTTAPRLGTTKDASGTSYMTKGYISNFRLVNGTALYTTNFTPATTPLTAISGTQVLTFQSATLVDNSTNNHTLTPTGTARPRQQNPFGMTTSSAQDYTPAVFGSSVYFDGSDYLEFPLTNNTFKFGTGEFTIEFWVYPTSAPNNNWSPFFTIGGSGGGQEIRIAQNILGGGYGYLIPPNSGTTDIYTSFGNFTLFEWHHLALVRSGTTVSFYRNGVLVGTTTSASFNFTNTSVGRIAYPQPAYADGSYIGYMSDVRVTNRALYTGGFVPPSAPLQAVQGTTLLLNMDKAAIADKSGKAVAETVGDTRLSTSVKKYGSSAMYFDGTGDYLSLPSNPLYAIGAAEDYTVECWVNFSTVQLCAFWQTTNNISSASGPLWFGYEAGNLKSSQHGSSTYAVSGAWTPSTGIWYHVAATRASGTTRLFVNGVIITTSSVQNNIAFTQSGGAVGVVTTPAYLVGYLDDLRFTKGYARYTSNFTPPAQALFTK